MAKLEQPRGLKITFKPSARQYELWKSLQPGVCECGGKLEMRPNGFDAQGHQIYKATCTKCGTTDIPEQILGGGAAGGGKALSLDSEIMTPFGARRLSALKVGDIITSATTGDTTEVIALHPIETRDYYRLHFADGTFVDCSDNHIWKGCFYPIKSKDYRGNSGCDELIFTYQLYERYQNNIGRKDRGESFVVPLCKPIKFNIPYRLPIHPYVAGVMIANERTNKASLKLEKHLVGIEDEDVIDRCIQLGTPIEKSTLIESVREKTYVSNDRRFIDTLIKSGIGTRNAVNKKIPRKFKLSTIKERVALIQGLMDCAGDCDEYGNISFSSVSKTLAEDFAFVIRSLGGIASITKKSLMSYRESEDHFMQCQVGYSVKVKINNAQNLFYCKRKKEWAKYILNDRVAELGKRIMSIEYIGKKEGRCITVKEPSGLFLTNNFTVTHNSYIGCAWLALSCMQFQGVRFVVARKVRKALLETTWNTLKNLLTQWGLKQDVNYHIDNLRYTITFWNGSEILAYDLTPSPGDPEWNSLGSLEITGAFVDESSEVSEKAIEVLASRIRYKIEDTFVVGKLLMTTNPTTGWLRQTFVMTDDYEPVQLPSGYRYIPFSLFDNPNEKFRAIYYNKLSQLRNPADKQRLLYGNWMFTEKNSLCAYHSFDGDKHLVQNLKEHYYDPLRPLILSFDMNVAPYMSCLPLQIDFDNHKIYFFPEYVGYPKDKLNNSSAFSTWIANQLLKQGHVGGLLLTGDPAGLSRSTLTEEGTNNFTIIRKNMQAVGLSAKIKLLSKHPSHITRLEFVNEVLGGYGGWQILIDARCHRLIEDFSYQKKNPDGTKEKKKVMGEGGVRMEKWGHFSDCFDYSLVYFLNSDYNKYKSATTDIVATIDMGSQVYGEFEY